MSEFLALTHLCVLRVTEFLHTFVMSEFLAFTHLCVLRVPSSYTHILWSHLTLYALQENVLKMHKVAQISNPGTPCSRRFLPSTDDTVFKALDWVLQDPSIAHPASKLSVVTTKYCHYSCAKLDLRPQNHRFPLMVSLSLFSLLIFVWGWEMAR